MILAVVEPGARAQPGLEKAARLAAARRARLLIYACDFREGLPAGGRGSAALRRRQIESGEATLRALARQYARALRRVGVHYELGHPRAPAILRAVRRARPDLVVIDSHFHRGVRRALFGPADWPLIRDCPAPLLYAKPRRWRAAPRVAAAVDPLHPADPAAALDRAVVRQAAAMARSLAGSLVLVNAWLPMEPILASAPAPGLVGVVDAGVLERLVSGAESAARAALASLKRRAGVADASIVLLRGAAVETLPGYAELEGLDLIAMGAVSRGRLYEALIGATAERLLERVPCDLLIVKAARPKARRRERR